MNQLLTVKMAVVLIGAVAYALHCRDAAAGVSAGCFLYLLSTIS